MAGSADEREIRDAVVAFIRSNVPEARIVHELVVGQCRADIGAVEPERLTLFEVKSKKDKLTRLERQFQAFERASHCTIVVAHARWFEEFDYHGGLSRGFRPCEALGCVDSLKIWRYPVPAPGEFAYRDPWRFPRFSIEQPHARPFLDLLWKDELLAECRGHRIVAGDRTTRWAMIDQMAYLMTGREIAQAVCRQLRSRPFPEADPPIIP